MNKIVKDGKYFVGYEYKEVTVDQEKTSMYLDAYLNFGWIEDDHSMPPTIKGKVIIRLKRDRKLLNKAELTRLQRHFEACLNELAKLEESKTSLATMWAIIIGVVGTVFIAGATFAVTATPPLVFLCILLAIPGFLGWIAPVFVYKIVVKKKNDQIEPLLEQKYEEIYEICEKGNKLLL